MFKFIWPIGLVVLSNVAYQVCSKSVPKDMSPFASLTVTYLIGAGLSALLYFVFNKSGNMIGEYSKLNWAPFALGIVIVGLEVGYIFAYKAGWQISVAATVQSAFVAVVLIFVGWLLYKEALTFNKLVGVVICLIGLVLINRK